MILFFYLQRGKECSALLKSDRGSFSAVVTSTNQRDYREGWPLLTDCFLKLRWMGTQRVQMKGVPVRWSCRYKRFLSCLGCLVGPFQNVFSLTVHYFNSVVPITQQAGQAVVLSRLSLSMCLWYQHTHVFSIPKAQWGLSAQLAIRFPIANNSSRWRGIFKGLSHDKGRTILAEIPTPLPLVKAFQLIPLLSRSISMDSTFRAHSVDPMSIFFFKIICLSQIVFWFSTCTNICWFQAFRWKRRSFKAFSFLLRLYWTYSYRH